MSSHIQLSHYGFHAVMGCALELWIKISSLFLKFFLPGSMAWQWENWQHKECLSGLKMKTENDRRQESLVKPETCQSWEKQTPRCPGLWKYYADRLLILTIISVTSGLLWVNPPKSSASIFLHLSCKIAMHRQMLICIKSIYEIHCKIKLRFEFSEACQYRREAQSPKLMDEII